CDKSAQEHDSLLMRFAVSPQSTVPTGQDLVRVQESFDKLVPVAGLAADLFYQRLFYFAPSLRRMFPDDMRDQKRSLMLTLAPVPRGLHDLDRLLPQVTALGAQPARYGVEAYHYQLVGETLIWTLERCLGNDFTSEVRLAWTRVYAVLAALMQEGAHEA